MRGHIAQKNGRYYTVISMKDTGTGKWRRKWLAGHAARRKAERALAEAVSQVNKGVFIIPSRETVAQLCRNYLATTAPNRVRPITLQSYRQMLETHVISRVGAKPATMLTPDDINSIMADIVGARKSVTTARYVHRVIHRVLDDAVRKGKLARNVADLADPPAAKKAETEVWDMDELDLFLTAAAKSDHYELFATLALTGMRRGEALGIRWRDMDLNIASPKVSICRTVYKLGKDDWRFEEPKTKRSRRVIALPISLAMLLQQLRERQEANARWYGRELSENDSIFVRNDGTLPDPRYVSKIFRRIVREAGLKRIRLHDLRHTYATLQRKAGQPIEVISRVLGHASEIVTLTVYNHWEGELRAPADAMDKMLEELAGNQNAETFVRKTLEEGGDLNSRPYRSRTCDTLIKSQVLYQLS